LGTAVAGTILVANLDKSAYGVAMLVLALIAVVGLAAAMMLPRRTVPPA
jgi:hypothetical protein